MQLEMRAVYWLTLHKLITLLILGAMASKPQHLSKPFPTDFQYNSTCTPSTQGKSK